MVEIVPGGIPERTVSVKGCVAVPAELLAVKVIGYVPAVPVGGVPLSVAVPLLLAVSVTPPGNGQGEAQPKLGVGVPVAVAVNIPNCPSMNVAELGDVNCGAVPAGALTVSVKF
jgi:hypothetical protein